MRKKVLGSERQSSQEGTGADWGGDQMERHPLEEPLLTTTQAPAQGHPYMALDQAPAPCPCTMPMLTRTFATAAWPMGALSTGGESTLSVRRLEKATRAQT